MKLLRQSISATIAVSFFLSGCAQAEDSVMEPVSANQQSADDNGQEMGQPEAPADKSAGGAAGSAVPALPAPGIPSSRKLVTEGTVHLSVEAVEPAIVAVRVEVLRIGGQVSSEQMSGANELARSGTLKVRVPPKEFDKFMDWLALQGAVSHRQLMIFGGFHRLKIFIGQMA